MCLQIAHGVLFVNKQPQNMTMFCVLRTDLLYYVMVGSRRLMPPDALQPKAYCTNPGLQSFLLARPGVSTRDPSSERRNYLGEKWPMNFDSKCPTST